MRNKKSTRNIPGVKRYTVGKGFTEQQKYRIDSKTPLSPEAVALLKSRPKWTNSFDAAVSGAEASARRILEQAGIPTSTVSSLIGIVKSRGYQERIDQEWYAAQVLWMAGAIRGTMRDGIGEDGKLRQGVAWSALYLAVHLGELVGEGKGRGYFERTGKAGGGKGKKIRPLFDWLRETVKQYPDRTAPFFWNSIPSHDEGDDPLLANGAEMIREGDLLVVKYDSGQRPSITYGSFRRYVTDAKKSLKL